MQSEICGLPTPHYSELDRQSWCTQGRRAEGDRRWRSNDLSLGYGASHIACGAALLVVVVRPDRPGRLRRHQADEPHRGLSPRTAGSAMGVRLTAVGDGTRHHAHPRREYIRPRSRPAGWSGSRLRLTRPRVWPPIHVDGSLASRRQAAPADRALSSPLGSPPMGRLWRPAPQRACREAPEGVCGRTPTRSVVSVGAVRRAPEKARHGVERQRHDSGDGAAFMGRSPAFLVYPALSAARNAGVY